MAGLIGALRVTLSADTAQFSKGMTNAQRQAKSSATAIQRSIGGIKAAFAGMAAGITVGTFVNLGRQALDFAGSLGETARAAGVTVEQLQILTRAAIANGVGQEQMVSALGRLNAKLGEAKAGSKEAIKIFADLGIKKEQLDSFQQAGDVLPHVMEGVKRLGVASLQAAAAKKIFGKAFAPLLPMLVEGADGYNQMAKAAQEAGLITAEQARRADEASDKLDLLAYSLKTNLTSALLDTLPAIDAVIAGLGNLISRASSAINWLNQLGGGKGGGGGGVGMAMFNAISPALDAVSPMLKPLMGGG